MLIASKQLYAKYPEYGVISTKKNGMTEFRLKKILARTDAQINKNQTKSQKPIKQKGTRKRKP
jgi:arsenate reductase-like glutaredoxin family protein